MSDVLARVERLAAGYGGEPVLRELSFTVAPGERVAVVGPNGAGKTTLLRVLLGELAPMAGTATLAAPAAVVAQTDRSRLDYPVSALDVALMGALPALPWWRPPGRRERRAALEALDDVGLGERAHETFGALSGGQRQRVRIARALVQDARLLMLDEPFVGLDAASVAALEALLVRLAADDRGLLVVTHDLERASRCDRVLVLGGPRASFGPAADVLAASAVPPPVGADAGVAPSPTCAPT